MGVLDSSFSMEADLKAGSDSAKDWIRASSSASACCSRVWVDGSDVDGVGAGVTPARPKMRIRCSSVRAALLDLAAAGSFDDVSDVPAASAGLEDHNHPIVSGCWQIAAVAQG